MSSGAEMANLTLFPVASTTVTVTQLPMTTLSPTFLLRTSMGLLLAKWVRVVCGMAGCKPYSLSSHIPKRDGGAPILQAPTGRSQLLVREYINLILRFQLPPIVSPSRADGTQSGPTSLHKGI